MRKNLQKLSAIIAVFVALVVPTTAFAANTPTLNQTVNAGTLTTDILQSDDTTPVASPAVGFPALNRSFSCQTNTATLGDTNNRIYVTNFDANSGWNLTMAATGGAGTPWAGTTYSYSFDDPAGSGCTNGQLTVDPSGGTITPNCNSVCNGVTVTKGSSTAFNNGSVDSVTLMSTADGTAWRGYLTGVGLSQEVPASQETDSYSLGMTITVTGV